MVDHIAHLTGRTHRRPLTNWQRLLIAIIIATGVFFLLYTLFPRVALVVAILGANTLLEQHKTLTNRSPLDLEVITIGVAYLAVSGSFGWALLVALIGPTLAHSTMAYFGDATVVKTVALVVVAIVGAVATPESLGGFFLVLVAGYLTQMLLFVALLGRSIITNVFARLTTAVFHAYIVFFLLRTILV